MQQNYKPGSNSSSDTAKKTKKTFWDGVTAIVKKIFRILRKLLTLLSEILHECLHTAVFLFSIAIKFISSPSTPCLLSIIIFGVVLIVTTGQWYALGLWFGRLFGLSSIGGYSAGFIGLFFGVCVNAFQLSSEMWKISRQFAEYYSKNNVNPNLETDADVSVKQRLTQWLSHDHKNLKAARRISYIVETTLMITYTLLGNFNPFGLILGVLSLFAPEFALKFVASTISLLGNIEGDSEEPEQKYKL
ncbi:hypothetical protein DSM106972_056460 [Dulcicalothrix desertica PCC 7102]|uniref:Uncharacterized protein n=1 Tax=Dulcicalothrix desertica PCC 7102 TaxID=232991 RepID=A0A3S1CFY3_9CYAN|nr:hypothetical protein [Dulcicalothrix desertica]RUT02726.1 hypothetical protein DSM106972_056460 [Dulcicalothrix desertica PCC 7102]TWH39039.1 hypothetical protein CAL7102_08243 [Dulcicalothrix desertica PCC 7102]